MLNQSFGGFSITQSLENRQLVPDYRKLGLTIVLVVHGQVDPLSDTGQPLWEAHGHSTLVHHVAAP